MISKSWIQIASFLAIISLVNLTSTPAQDPSRQLMQNSTPKQSAAKRIALVIGNGAYTNAPPLRNPPNDARDMAATLKTLGFGVTSGINVGQREMKRLIREFGQKLKAGGSGLFYYAGHGVQSKGRNYLIPIDANIQSEAEVEDSSVDANLVLSFMDEAQNGLNIVILDACRNNPFARSFRSASDGLAQVDAPTGTLIAYATAPGRVASDGTGQNGLYTSELLKQMRVPGLPVTEMFMRVRAEVMKQTGNKQVPWEASSLVGSFSFSNQQAASSTTAGNSSASDSKTDSAFELTFWNSIKDSKDAADFKSYLEQYPSGRFAALARNRLKTLAAAKTQPAENGGGSPAGANGSALRGSGASPANCFGTDGGAASTDWQVHHDWAGKQDLERLRSALDAKLVMLFQCSSRTDEQLFDTFADISVTIARYVPDAGCFDGDAGVVTTDRLGHRNWAKERGRNGALSALQSKALAALNCLNGSKLQSYYADVSVLIAGGGAPKGQTASPQSEVVNGGLMNDKAITLVQPEYPEAARSIRAMGQVEVSVLIDKDGNVVSAHAVSGPPLLQLAAIKAARASKFRPTFISGQPVMVSGTIVYNFELR